MATPIEQIDKLFEFDETYTTTLNDIMNFFRFEKRNPGTVEFDDAYYARAAKIFKDRIDIELKHVRNTYLK